MNIKKFVAATSREALKLVRQQLGGDAVILSNRSVPDGVEIVALPGAAMNTLVAAAETNVARPAPAPAPVQSTAAPAARAEPRSVAAAPAWEPPLASKRPRATAPHIVSARPAPTAPAPRVAAAIPAPPQEHVMEEIKNMRSALEQGFARLAFNDMQQREPTKAKLLRALLGASFSPVLARSIISRLPADFSERQATDWTKEVLGKNMHCLQDEGAMLDRGGVYALVGPTGVGKTTTTAKLAARCVVRHGADKVALLTTDGYRIGAHEQLRTYGKLLGVSVHVVRDAADLRVTLEDLASKHMVLIDTVGMSHRDRQVAEQVAMFNGCRSVKRLLLLNATAHGETLEDVVEAYKGDGLAGCILSKVDESAALGTSLDIVIRHKLSVYYAATGQRVPEDLHAVTPNFLVDQALRARSRRSLFQMNDEEVSLTWQPAPAARKHAHA
jgi:flagellar biosynthesis protein FlhF